MKKFSIIGSFLLLCIVFQGNASVKYYSPEYDNCKEGNEYNLHTPAKASTTN